MPHTQAINENRPQGSEPVSQGDDEFRALKRDIRERMALEHEWSGDLNNDGKHKNLNADALTTGTVPPGRIPNPLPVVSGQNLTNLPAGNLVGGPIPGVVLPANLAKTDILNIFTQPQSIKLPSAFLDLHNLGGSLNKKVFRITSHTDHLIIWLVSDDLSVILGTPFVLDSVGNLSIAGVINATGLGTTPLPANVAKLDVSNTFTQSQIFSAPQIHVYFRDSAGAVNQKVFQWVSGGGFLYLRALTDDYSTVISVPFQINGQNGDVVVQGIVQSAGLGTTPLNASQLTSGTVPRSAFLPFGNIVFDAANFFGELGGTWTVAAGDIVTNQYRLLGNSLLVNFYIINSSISPGGAIFLRVPAVAVHAASGFAYASTGATPLALYTEILAGSDLIAIRRISASNFASGIYNQIQGQLEFEVV